MSHDYYKGRLELERELAEAQASKPCCICHGKGANTHGDGSWRVCERCGGGDVVQMLVEAGKERDRLAAALEFYADEENYMGPTGDMMIEDPGLSSGDPVSNDSGERARQALAGGEGE